MAPEEPVLRLLSLQSSNFTKPDCTKPRPCVYIALAFLWNQSPQLSPEGLPPCAVAPEGGRGPAGEAHLHSACAGGCCSGGEGFLHGRVGPPGAARTRCWAVWKEGKQGACAPRLHGWVCVCVCARVASAGLHRLASEPGASLRRAKQTTRGTDGAPGKTGPPGLKESVERRLAEGSRFAGERLPCVRLLWERQGSGGLEGGSCPAQVSPDSAATVACPPGPLGLECVFS